MSEAQTQRAILDYLALKKHFCWRNNSGAFKTEHGGFYRAGTPGSPDIICVIEGEFVGIEVKSEKGKLSPSQEIFKDAIQRAGGRYEVVRNIDDLQSLNL